MLAALAAGATIGAISGMAIYAFAYPVFQSDEWAAWVQAVGSIAAVASGFYLNYSNQRKEKLIEINNVLDIFTRISDMLEGGALVSMRHEKGGNELDASKKAVGYRAGSINFKSNESGYAFLYQKKGFNYKEFFFLIESIEKIKFTHLGPMLEFKIKELTAELNKLKENISRVVDKFDKAALGVSCTQSDGTIVSLPKLEEIIASIKERKLQI